MKKIFLFVLISLISIPYSALASDTLDKDNVLIYAEENGTARGYDLLWKAENITGTFAQESAVIRKDDVVYVNSIQKDGMPGNNDVFALNAYTGEIIAQVEIGPSFGDPTIDGNTLYIGTGDESWDPDSSWTGGFGLYSFDISDIKNSGFQLNWFQSIPNKIVPNLMIDDQHVYFAEFEGNQFKALDKNTGVEVWTFTKGNYGAAINLLHDGFLYITNSFSGPNSLYKVNASDGTLVWEKPIIGKLWDNSVTYSSDHDALFLTSYYQSKAASYDLDGNEIWQLDINCQSLSFTSYHNNSVFFSDLCGWVYSVNATTGVLEWSTQIGKAGSQITDIASPVIANGQIFIGTKGPGYNTVNTRGRGEFYILDEETGEVLWRYEDESLGDIMALATIADGIFYNVTNAYDVYAFDVGDGSTSDHFLGNYNEDNTFSTQTGLTQNKYVEMVCSRSGDENNCDISNSYTGRAIETKIDFDTAVIESVLLENDKYHINVDGSEVYMPVLPATGSINNIIITSNIAAVYDSTLPRLTNISQDDAAILEASYVPSDEKVIITVDKVDQFNAEVENFSKPFIGTQSILDNSSVIISRTESLVQEMDIISSDMLINTSTGTADVYISGWTEDTKKWTETGSDLVTTSSHTINNLIPNQKYILTINGESQDIIADSGGEISFDFLITNESHAFELVKYTKPKSTGLSITYTCKDTSANNYNPFGRHKQSKCEYDNEDVVIIEPVSIPTESNPFGGEQCPAELIITNNMKNGDTNGFYSSYNNGIVTEVSILQAHINRLLVDDYGTQAAGPVDKWFRSKTQRGVERLQTKLNQLLEGEIVSLDIDGIVGPFTKAAINMSC